MQIAQVYKDIRRCRRDAYAKGTQRYDERAINQVDKATLRLPGTLNSRHGDSQEFTSFT